MVHPSPIYLHHHLLLSILFVSGTIPNTLSQSSTPPPGPPAQPPGPFLIGSLRSCAHNLSGNVYIKNANQIEIKNFTYDGQGTNAYFHVMTPKALSIHAAIPGTFFPVSSDNKSCSGLNRSYSQEDVTLTLPIGDPLLRNFTVIQIKSFGVFSYGKSGNCSNYGNVYFIHKWPALLKHAATGGLGPPSAPVNACAPHVFPDLSNPEFCHPGQVRFREFFGKCVEQYGAIPRSGGGGLAVLVEILWEKLLIILIAHLGMIMTTDLYLYFDWF